MWRKSHLPLIVVSQLLGSVVLSLCLALGFAPVASAATLCVNPGGTDGCFSTIQAAINAASNPGDYNNRDTVTVAAGTYTEQLDINKPLNLRGRA